MRAPSSQSRSSLNALEFTTGASAEHFSITGTYGFTTDSGASIFYQVYLYDVANAVYLFDNYQHSSNALGESFAVGEEGGNFENILAGNLTGDLLPNSAYEFGFDAWIVQSDDDEVSLIAASSTGFVSLELAPLAGAVPEPASLVVWSLLGGLGIAVGSWRKRNAARQG